VAESQVWEAVMRLLNQPERIRHEVARQHAQVDGQQEIIRAERETLQRALAKCEQAEQRWRDANSEGAISLAEFKVYRADIQPRRATPQVQLQALDRRAEALRQQLTREDSLIDYCQRVRNRLKTFSLEEKQRAFDALALRVAFRPKALLRIEARIPVVSESNAS
jgi:prefoldin subunit 5